MLGRPITSAAKLFGEHRPNLRRIDRKPFRLLKGKYSSNIRLRQRQNNREQSSRQDRDIMMALQR
jgi:hypothetical protein